jgi:cytochrome c
MKSLIVAVGLALSCAMFATDAPAQGNAEDGEAVFRKCATCHKVGPDAKNANGPVLNGVLGRQAGTIADFGYSDLNKSAGANGLVWTEDMIFEYLADPSPFLKKFLTDKGKPELAQGATKMVFKLPDATDRRDVIAYLKKFSK